MSPGGGDVAAGGGGIVALPLLAAIAASNAIGRDAIVILGDVATVDGSAIAVDVGRGRGEGGKFVDGGAADDGRDWRDGSRDGAKGSAVVEHDRDGGRANPDEAWCKPGWGTK
jgi:hypothetical protein